MSATRKEQRAKKQEFARLQNEVFNLKCTLDELYSRFDMVTDSVQVDACIYEMNAVMARYDYALKCLKAFDMS
ncbi:MAG: DUF2508 family protein [Oscillospiraceae bacterium]|nr:DUF2508 family protein [Oscillospiraceae bacterium]